MTDEEARAVVEANIGERIKLSEFRPTVTDLTPAERELVIDQAVLMLEQVYVHLPLKRAIHGTEPIQRLRLLRLQHETLDERAFQSAMIDIFTDLRDLHTGYTLPESYGTRFAFLPFRIEEYYEEIDGEQARKYVVSLVSPVNPDPNLTVGVEVTHWNGSPVDLAVARHAEREAGSNLEARRARGIEGLTLRWFGDSLPPDEDWVVLTYTDGTTTRETKFFWEVIDATDRPTLLPRRSDEVNVGQAQGDPALGIDLKTDLLYRVRTAVFDPVADVVDKEVAARRNAAAADGDRATAAAGPPLAAVSDFRAVFPRFGEITAPNGPFGYIRLRSFRPTLTDETVPPREVIRRAVNEFSRILSLMPPAGLILDIRGNGGGYVSFGELILQHLTPKSITPAPFHFLATPLTHRITQSVDELSTWRKPIGQAIATGASYSQGFPLTPPARANAVGQVYQGPVVVITDALCYSTTDIFAAAFQDHKIGKVLGCHGNTGAGGANVWEHATDLTTLALPPSFQFTPLPQNAGMRVAIRRCTRVGDRSGVPVEDLGVEPDIPYFMTRRDVLEHNVDLIAKAASVLTGMEKQTLRLTEIDPAPAQRLRLVASSIDRVDLLVEGRPVVTQDVTGGEVIVELPTPVPAETRLTANGYRNGELVVSTRRRV